MAGTSLLCGSLTAVRAVNVSWTNWLGNYTNGANWSAGTMPAAGDTVIFTNGGTATFDGAFATNTLWIANTTYTTGTLTQTAGILTSTVVAAMGGGAGASAALNVSGGALYLPLGLNSGYGGGQSTVTVGSGGVLSSGAGTGEIRIGGDGNAGTLAGQGFLNVNGGAVTGGGWFVVGRDGDTGTVTMTSGSLVKAGVVGTGFTIGAVNGFGRVDASGGTISVLAGSTFVGEQGSGQLNLSGTAVMTSAAYLVIGRQANSVGQVNLSGSAALTVTGALQLGSNATAVARLTQGGSSTLTVNGGDSRIGAVTNGYGYFQKTGGTLTMNPNYQIGAYGNGVMDLAGGSWSNANWPCVGRYGSGEGVLNISGGTFVQTGAAQNLIVAEEGVGTLNMIGTGTATLVGGLRIGNTVATATGTVNLVGGTIVTPFVTNGNGTADASLNFNGGTLRASAGAAMFLQGLDRAYVYPGGAKIDTQAYNDTITQDLLAPAGSGVVSIAVGSAGANYIGPPLVRITGGGGYGATAIAQIDAAGTITNFLVTNPGTGYTSDPTITLVGGGGTGGAAGSAGFAPNGSGGLTKTGAGTLTLSGANTFTGPMVISGVVSVVSLANGGATSGIGASPAASSNLVLTGGTLQYTGPSVGIDRGYTLLAGNNTLNTANDLTLSGAPIVSSGAIFFKAGAGTLTLTDPGPNTLAYNAAGGLALYVNGGRLALAGGAAQAHTIVGEIAVGTLTTAAANLDIHGGTNNATSWLSVGRGNGTTGLRSTLNVYSGLVTAAQASMGYAAGVAGFRARPQINLYNDGVLNLTNHIFVGESSGADAEINLFNNSVMKTGGRMQLGLNTSSTGTVSVTENGTLQIGTFLDLGPAASSAGKLTASGTGTVSVATYVWMGGGAGALGTLAVSNQATVTIGLTNWIGAANGGKGRVYVSDTATLNAGAYYIGAASGGVGVVYQSGGSVNTVAGNDSMVGQAAGSYGYYRLAGGTLNSPGNFQVGAYGTGVMEMSGGVWTNASQYPVVGRYAGGVGVLNVSGGTVYQPEAGTRLIVGEQGVGTLNLSGTGTLNLSGGLRVSMDYGGTPGTGTVNLAGGTLLTPLVEDASTGDSTFNFDGGTLRAAASSTMFMEGLDRAYVRAGGATIDTAGFDVTVAQPLLAPTGDGVASIPVAAGGSGYLGAPAVVITGGGGAGATAIAQFDPLTGTVTNLLVTSPGTDYTSAPTVTLVGGGGSGAAPGAAGTAANAGGGLTKLGPGTLTLAGDNTYGGPTVVAEGRLAIGTPLAVQNSTVSNLVDAGVVFSGVSAALFGGLAGPGGVALYNDAGGAVALAAGNNGADTTYDGVLNDQGWNSSLTKVGAGVLTLTADQLYLGGTTVSNGTLRLGNGAGPGGSLVGDMINCATVVFQHSAGATNTYGGNLTGTGGQVVVNGGRLILTGTNLYDGATAVSNGTLLVNGIHGGAGLITVCNGATLGGGGTLRSAVEVQSGGTLAPGNSPGTLTASNSVSLQSGSIFAVELEATNSYDRLQFADGGSLALNDAVLQVNLSFPAALGDTFTIVAGYLEPVSGRFNTLTGNPAEVRPSAGYTNTVLRVDYDAGAASDEITLTVIPEPGTLGLVVLAALATLRRRRKRAEPRARSAE